MRKNSIPQTTVFLDTYEILNFVKNSGSNGPTDYGWPLNSNCKMYIDSPVASTSEMLNGMNVEVCFSTHGKTISIWLH